jgi:hypothetical protein
MWGKHCTLPLPLPLPHVLGLCPDCLLCVPCSAVSPVLCTCTVHCAAIPFLHRMYWQKFSDVGKGTVDHVRAGLWCDSPGALRSGFCLHEYEFDTQGIELRKGGGGGGGGGGAASKPLEILQGPLDEKQQKKIISSPLFGRPTKLRWRCGWINSPSVGGILSVM